MVRDYKICIITTVGGTIKAFFLEQIEALIENGYDVTIICNEYEGFDKIIDERVKYIDIPMKRGMDPINGVDCILKMYKIFKKNNFDIIQYSTPNASIYASIASKLAGNKIRLYHNMGYRYVTSTGIKRMLLKLLEKITCQLSTEVQVVSFSNLEFGISERLFSRKKSNIVWNGSTGGVNLDKFNISRKTEWRNEIKQKYNINNDVFVFGFVGRITRDKGINELLEAYQKLSINSKKSMLVIVGVEESTKMLDKNLYEWSKDRDDILFVGKSNEIYKYMSSFDVLVLPSYREGFGNVIIEAQALAVPVIVSDIPGPTEAMIKDITGKVVEKKNVNDLYKTMLYMYDDSEKCEAMGREAYIYVKENFDSKKLIRYIIQDKERMIDNYLD